MKYTLKIAITLIITSIIMTTIIWVFSSSERQYALNQYLNVNQNTANLIQYSVRDKIELYTNDEDVVDYNSLVNSLEKYDFNSISILSSTGTILASTDENIKDAYIFTLGEEGKNSFFQSNGANFILNGNSYYFAKIISDDYRVMCVILQSKLLAEKTKISVLNAVEVIILLAFFGICATLTVIFYKQKFNVLYKVKPVNNYTLSTSKYGNLLYADSNFNKTFGKVNLSENIIGNKENYIDELSSGRLLLFNLTDKEGKDHKVAFNVTSGLGEYKFVGSDVSEFMQEHENLVEEHNTDFQTGLKNEIIFQKDWKQCLNEDNYKDGLMCFFGTERLDYYNILYGQKNFIKGYKLFLQKFKEYMAEYGELYSVNGYNFIWVKDKTNRDKFITNIKKINDFFNQAVEIGNQIIKPDVRMGVIFLSNVNKDTKIDYLLGAGRRALNAALVTHEVPYYIQRSTNFGENSYQVVTSDHLHELFARGGLDVWFQPQVNPFTENVVGLEGLLRMTDSKAKEIKISDFVESAEKSGCIIELGEFIYKKCMDFAVAVQDYGVSVSINLSPIQFMQAGFCEKFLQEYNARKLKPNSIHVEILESTMIYSIDDVISKLNILRKNGIAVEVDDFGISYSSMSYLKRLPINTLKIDMAFIKDMTENETDRLLVKNIVNITKDLKLECVSEGVETKEQLEMLKKFGCEIIQGYYYSKALPRDQVFDYIKKMNKVEVKKWLKI